MQLSRLVFLETEEDPYPVSASRRPVMGACRVRGDRGVFDRAGRRLAETFFWGPNETTLMEAP